MHSPDRGPLWALRTAVLAVGCTGLAWGGHLLGSGGIGGAGPVTPGAFVLATLFTALLLTGFTRVERGLGEIFAVLAAAQVVLHLVFTFSAPAAGAAPAAAVPMPAGAMATHGHVLAGYSPGMLAGHLWAALLAAALLSRGEQALWTLLALLDRALPGVMGAVRSWTPPGPAAATAGPVSGSPLRVPARRARPRAPPQWASGPHPRP